MMYEETVTSVEPNSQEGARALLTQLYREIGISAVAAALEVSRLPDPGADKAEAAKEIPAILRGHELAA